MFLSGKHSSTSFLAEFEITNIKSQITSADGSASTKITESYGFIGHWDLVFEFYPRLNLSPNSLIGEHSGTSLGFYFDMDST